jgi:hypothetical protein
VLYVGYLNGAVGQLRIAPRYTGPSETMRGQSTGPMRSRYGLRRTSLTLLAFAMAFSALVAAATLLCRFYLGRQQRLDQRDAELTKVFAVYRARVAADVFRSYTAPAPEALAAHLGVEHQPFLFTEVLEECKLRDGASDEVTTPCAVRLLAEFCFDVERERAWTLSRTEWADLLRIHDVETLLPHEATDEVGKLPRPRSAATLQAALRRVASSKSRRGSHCREHIREDTDGHDDRKAGQGTGESTSGAEGPAAEPAGGAPGMDGADGVDDFALGDTFTRLLGTLQITALYAGVIAMPPAYRDALSPIFDVLSLRFLATLFDDAIVALAVMLAVAAALLAALAFVLLKDDAGFYRNVLRYQHRRDRVDGVEGSISEAALYLLLRRVDPDFVKEPQETFANDVTARLLSTAMRGDIPAFLADASTAELKLADDPPLYLRKCGKSDSVLARFFTQPIQSVGIALPAESSAADLSQILPNLSGGASHHGPPRGRHDSSWDAALPPGAAFTASLEQAADARVLAAAAGAPIIRVENAQDASAEGHPRPHSPDLNFHLELEHEASREEEAPACFTPPYLRAETQPFRDPSPASHTVHDDIATTQRQHSWAGSVVASDRNGGTTSEESTPDGLSDQPHLVVDIEDIASIPDAAAVVHPGDHDADETAAAVPSTDVEPVVVVLSGGSTSMAADIEVAAERAVVAQSSESLDAVVHGSNAKSSVGTGQPLVALSACCPLHGRHRLKREEQSNIFPYSHPRHCCIGADGVRCNRRVGILYQCPHEDSEGEEDCPYAVCDEHFQVGRVARLRARGMSFIDEWRGRPWSWLISYAFIAIAGAAYVPVVSAALMVVSCHPQYQCVFEGCWASPTVRFVAAAYLAALVIVAYGFGFPISVLVLVWRRQRVLQGVFTSPFYLGRYMGTPDTPIDAAETLAQTFTSSLWFRVASLTSKTREFASRYAEAHGHLAVAGSAQRVDPAEYRRYLMTCPSVVRELIYEDYKFEWMTLGVVMTYGQILLLLGPLLLDRGSLAQLGAMGAAEVFFFAITATTDSHRSPWMLLTDTLGSLHQFAFIGLIAYTTAVSYERDVSATTGAMMLTSTVAYVAITVVLATFLVFGGTLSRIRRNRQTAAFLKRFGLARWRAAPMYLTPAEDAVLQSPRSGGPKRAPPLSPAAARYGVALDGGVEEDEFWKSQLPADHADLEATRSLALESFAANDAFMDPQFSHVLTPHWNDRDFRVNASSSVEDGSHSRASRPAAAGAAWGLSGSVQFMADPSSPIAALRSPLRRDRSRPSAPEGARRGDKDDTDEASETRPHHRG